MTRPIGATPQEWAGLAVTLGLEADLLPVVSNRARSVSAQSQLHANPDQVGKVPSILNQRGEIAGMPGWSKHITTERDIARWAKEPDLGICVIGRTLKGIDIDVADPAKAQHVRSLFEMLLGKLPARTRGNSGKCLLAVRLPVFMPKWKFEVDGGVVEILGDNQQFIAVGTHPSGVRYEWAQGLPAAVPEVSAAELQDAVLAVYAARGVQGTLKQGREVLAGTRARHAVDAEDDAVEYLWGGGWVREEQVDGSLYVVCPWQHEHTDGAAGAPSATIFYPAGVGADKRGFKCLHAHCEGRTNREFLAKTGFTAAEVADEFEDVAPAVRPDSTNLPRHRKPFVTDAEWPNWSRDKKGGIVSSHTSIGQAIARPDICGAQLAYDEFKAETMIEWVDAQGTWRPMSNTDCYKLCMRLESVGFVAPKDAMVDRAVAYVARANSFDSARDWLFAQTWDGVSRCETFFIDCWGVPDTPYARAVGRYLWSAMAGRVELPGCKADMTPVLISPEQGLRKTAGVMAMAPEPDAFVELDMDQPDKELSYKIRGKLIGELGEMRGMSGREQEGIKQWLSRPFEEFREVFQPRMTKFQRRVVFVGTGNREGILVDETGNRRWLPMVVSKVDDARIARERDQLWAEGRILFCANGHMPEWQDAQDLAPVEHERFMEDDDWVEVIKTWVEADGMDGEEGPKRGDSPLRGVDIMVGALGMAPASIKPADQKRMGRAMRTLGFVAQAVRVKGEVTKRWIRKTQKFC